MLKRYDVEVDAHVLDALDTAARQKEVCDLFAKISLY